MVAQRERLLSATAVALSRDENATIAVVVGLARVSRNTFYEYFDDLAHARRAVVQRATQRLEQALRGAEQRSRTPVERWRALARAWFGWIEAAPAEARLVLATSEAALSDAGSTFEVALKRSLDDVRAFGVKGAELSGARVVAAAAACEAFGREFASKHLDADSPTSSAERERLERELTDVAIRMLR